MFSYKKYNSIFKENEMHMMFTGVYITVIYF